MKMNSKILLGSILLFLVACNELVGVVNHFEVKNPFSLTSSRGAKITFNAGAQDGSLWKVSATEKDKKPVLTLIRIKDEAKFELNANLFDVKNKLTHQKDATSAWRDDWRSCSYTDYQYICNGPGQCFTQPITRYGNERVRYRTVGSYDDYDVVLSTKAGAELALLQVTMDNTQEETQIIFQCH